MIRVGIRALAGLLIVAASAARADGPPSWKFRAGETLRYAYRFTTEAEVDAKGAVDAGPRKSGIALEMDWTWTVDRVGDDGTAAIIATIDRVRLSFFKEHGPDASDRATYGSDDPKTVDNPWSALMDEAFRPLVGKPIAMKIDPRGRIVGFTLPEAAKAAWKGMPWLKARGQSFAPLFSEGGLSGLLAIVLPETPGEAVGGDGDRAREWGGEPFDLRFTDAVSKPVVEGDALRVSARTEAVPTDPKALLVLSPWPLSPSLSVSSRDPVEFDAGKLERKAGDASFVFDAKSASLTGAKRDLAFRVTSDCREKPGAPKAGSLAASFRLEARMKRKP